MSNRRKIIKITARAILGIVVRFSQLQHDVEFVDVHYDDVTECFNLKLEHKDFKEIPELAPIPLENVELDENRERDIICEKCDKPIKYGEVYWDSEGAAFHDSHKCLSWRDEERKRVDGLDSDK